MTPKYTDRPWFNTIVGTTLCLGGLALHVGFPGRMGQGLTLGIIVIGAALIDGSRIVSVVRARFSRRP